MAISLKNIEDRLRALESMNNSKVKFTKIFQTTSTKSNKKSIAIPNLDTYDAIYIRIRTMNAWNAGDVAIIP